MTGLERKDWLLLMAFVAVVVAGFLTSVACGLFAVGVSAGVFWFLIEDGKQ